jgi:hypothetical protein
MRIKRAISVEEEIECLVLVNSVGFAYGATDILGTESKLTPVKQNIDLMQHSYVGEVACSLTLELFQSSAHKTYRLTEESVIIRLSCQLCMHHLYHTQKMNT